MSGEDWSKRSFTREELEGINFKLPFRREDMNEDTAAKLTAHFAERQAAEESAAREDRAESWLSRFLAIWNR